MSDNKPKKMGMIAFFGLVKFIGFDELVRLDEFGIGVAPNGIKISQ